MMRSLLTGGIKAILAIAALSTAAHWVLRVQRDAEGIPAPAVAALPDPVTTGSIAPRASVPSAPEPVAVPQRAAEAPKAKPAGLDQSHLAALIATATSAPTKAKPAKR